MIYVRVTYTDDIHTYYSKLNVKFNNLFIIIIDYLFIWSVRNNIILYLTREVHNVHTHNTRNSIQHYSACNCIITLILNYTYRTFENIKTFIIDSKYYMLHPYTFVQRLCKCIIRCCTYTPKTRRLI